MATARDADCTAAPRRNGATDSIACVLEHEKLAVALPPRLHDQAPVYMRRLLDELVMPGQR